jgi:hypothetical protein
LTPLGAAQNHREEVEIVPAHAVDCRTPSGLQQAFSERCSPISLRGRAKPGDFVPRASPHAAPADR